MSIQPVPKSLSDEINQTLTYRIESNIDFFTLKTYQYKLEQLKKKKKVGPDEYEALAKTYFHLKKYREYVVCLQEGIERFKSLGLLHSYIMGKLMLYAVTNRAFDIQNEWFDHKLNPNKESFNFLFQREIVTYLGNHFQLKKTLRGSLSIDYSLICYFTVGPLKVTGHYHDFTDQDYGFGDYVIRHFAERLQLGTLSDEEAQFFLEILGQDSFNEIKRLSRDHYKTERLCFRSIPGFDRELKKELVVTVIQENDYFLVNNSELGLYEGGESKDEALADFFSLFIDDCSNWIEGEDEDLSDNAVVLKQKYLDYVN